MSINGTPAARGLRVKQCDIFRHLGRCEVRALPIFPVVASPCHESGSAIRVPAQPETAQPTDYSTGTNSPSKLCNRENCSRLAFLHPETGFFHRIGVFFLLFMLKSNQ
jgi:hypothetical protein